MRYADGGGLSEQGRAKREAVRLQAAEWFAQDVPVAEIPADCGCRPTRSTSGAGDGELVVGRHWRRRGQEGRTAGSIDNVWTG